MDRVIVYPSAIPQDTDLLNTNKNVMVSLGYLMQALLGTSPLVDGLACTPTSPAGMTVNVAGGSIYALEEIDATGYGSIPADTTDQIVKQGVVISTTNFSCAAPGTSGQSVVYLVQVAYQDVDGGSTVLPYYNSADPAVPFSGPGNDGQPQNTVRQGVCHLTLKTGVAATTGTQVTPTPDAGFVGLWAITVANGQTTITSGNIAQLSTAPFISPKLPAMIAAVQTGSQNFAHDTSISANTLTIALNPSITQLTDGMRVWVKVANATTGAVVMNTNGLGNVSVVTPAGSALANGAFSANGVYGMTYDGNGTRWVYDGSGNLSVSLPDNPITGTNHTFAAGDSFALTRRSNSGTAMADTLPGTSGALPNGWFTYLQNVDSTAADVVGVGSGGTINLGLNTGSFQVMPGETWIIQSRGSGVYDAWRTASAVLHAAPTKSSFKHLAASWASNTTANISADELVLEDSNGNTRRITSFSQTFNSAATVGTSTGLDTGTLAASTWYYGYAIFNPATGSQGCIFSASSSSPTLPSGYTFASGPLTAFFSDGSKHFLGFLQFGRDWQYIVGSNLSGLPAIITGSSGSTSTPTWTSASVSTVAPTSIAGRIKLVLFNDNSGGTMAAPNNSYGAFTSTSNPPPLVGSGSQYEGNIMGDFVLESTNVYYASAASAGGLYCMGFTINIERVFMFCYSNNGLSMRRVDPDYVAQDGEALFPYQATTSQLISAFPAYSDQAAAVAITQQIIALELTVTPRRLREAVLGSDNGWFANLNSQIAALRAQL